MLVIVFGHLSYRTRSVIIVLLRRRPRQCPATTTIPLITKLFVRPPLPLFSFYMHVTDLSPRWPQTGKVFFFLFCFVNWSSPYLHVFTGPCETVRPVTTYTWTTDRTRGKGLRSPTILRVFMVGISN